jgi:hypothetical protein
MNTTATGTTTARSSSRTRRARRIGAVAAATVTAGVSLLTVAPAQAATNYWYGIPGFSGGSASVNMTTFQKGYASGYAAGQIYLKSTGSKLYVQRKPNEGGTWKRSTTNRTSGAGYYNWNDSFTLNYSGFMFRICRDQIGPDACGTAIKVYG